jgi:hypothetical protein
MVVAAQAPRCFLIGDSGFSSGAVDGGEGGVIGGGGVEIFGAGKLGGVSGDHFYARLGRGFGDFGDYAFDFLVKAELFICEVFEQPFPFAEIYLLLYVDFFVGDYGGVVLGVGDGAVDVWGEADPAVFYEDF